MKYILLFFLALSINNLKGQNSGNIQNSLSNGFDPAVLKASDQEREQRLRSLSEPLYTGPDPNLAFPEIKPYKPKEIGNNKGDEVDVSGLLNSGDPDQIQKGVDYVVEKGLQSEALQNGFYDHIYKTNSTMGIMQKKGYSYNMKLSEEANLAIFNKLENEKIIKYTLIGAGILLFIILIIYGQSKKKKFEEA